MRVLNFFGFFAIPLALLAHLCFHTAAWEPFATFGLAAIGIIPLARLMGEATEHLAEITGPAWGGLVNATFGNAAELIIAIVAVLRGLNDIVKASLTGSILGNLLLVAGGAMVVGGWKREKQCFSRATAETNAGMLVMAIAALLLPAMFHFSARLQPVLAGSEVTDRIHSLSLGTSVVLLAVYGLGMVFTLRTHAHLFSPEPARSEEGPLGISGLRPHRWTIRRCVLMLLIASVGVAIVAELLVGSAEHLSQKLGWSEVFIGVIVLAIIGNAAEHSTAIQLAMHNDMDTAMAIVYQSSLQIALFVTPLIVLLSAGFGALHLGNARSLDLLFSPMEVVAVILTVAIVVVLNMNGQTNWFEGVLLLAMYTILGIAFFYIPSAPVGH